MPKHKIVCVSTHRCIRSKRDRELWQIGTEEMLRVLEPTDVLVHGYMPDEVFAENSWYFRNALVRANYNNIKDGVYETTEFLEKFLRNLLLNEHHELQNREMHISGKFVLGHDDPINDPIKFDDREKQILELLREEANLTRKEMAERLECSDSTIKRTLQSMVEKGAIKRIGSNKKGEWIIFEGK